MGVKKVGKCLSVSDVDGRPHYSHSPWAGPRERSLGVSCALTVVNVSNEASRPHQKHSCGEGLARRVGPRPPTGGCACL